MADFDFIIQKSLPFIQSDYCKDYNILGSGDVVEIQGSNKAHMLNAAQNLCLFNYFCYGQDLYSVIPTLTPEYRLYVSKIRLSGLKECEEFLPFFKENNQQAADYLSKL